MQIYIPAKLDHKEDQHSRKMLRGKISPPSARYLGQLQISGTLQCGFSQRISCKLRKAAPKDSLSGCCFGSACQSSGSAQQMTLQPLMLFLPPKSIWSKVRMPFRATLIPVSSSTSRSAAARWVSWGFTPPPGIHHRRSRSRTQRNRPRLLRQMTSEYLAMGSSSPCEAIQSIIIASSAMGAACETICEPAIDRGELGQIFRDGATGRLLGLSAEERQKYCDRIGEIELREGVANELFGDPLREEGFIYCPQRYFYEGRRKEGVPHGKGRLVLLAARVAVEGWFREGRAEGECVVTGEGIRVEGRWRGGLPHQVRLQNGSRQYFIEFGLPSLTSGKIIFPNGSIYRGEFRFDFEERTCVMEGKGLLTYLNGNTLEGVFTNGYLEGEGVFESKSQACVYRGTFRQGMFEGAGEMEMGDEGVLRIWWRANRPHGQGEFIRDGFSVKIFYVNGVRQSSLVSHVNEDHK